MTSSESMTWLSELPQKAQLFTITFVQLGQAATDLRKQLPGIPGTHLTVRDYLADEATELQSPILLYEFDRMRRDRGQRLGELRDRVMRDALCGHYFVFVSVSPKTAYPDTRGSDIVADAKQVFAPSAMLAASGEASHYDFFVAIVRELGERTVIAISEAMWESQLSSTDALDSLSRPDVEALRGAGLVQAEGEVVSWAVTSAQGKTLKAAVAQVCSEGNEAGDSVASAFVEIWTLERDLRNIIRAALVERMKDGWRETCLPDHLRIEVLDRARRDTQPGASKLGDLRDPLEWLTTSELLDLRESRELGGLGLEPYMWLKLRNEVLPIRNKLAHMRLVSSQDVQRAAVWRRLIAQRRARRS